MYHRLNDFFISWEFEAKATSKILKNLNDESLNFEVAPQHWTLGRIAWHTVTSIKVISILKLLVKIGTSLLLLIL